MHADERQTPTARTREFSGRQHLSSWWILLLQQGRWLCKPHGKDYQNNHKGHDHQNNLSMEDSQDEWAKGQQSSFLKVLTVLNNSHFFSLSSFWRETANIKNTQKAYCPCSPAERPFKLFFWHTQNYSINAFPTSLSSWKVGQSHVVKCKQVSRPLV